jgi:hypothetical protein
MVCDFLFTFLTSRNQLQDITMKSGGSMRTIAVVVVLALIVFPYVSVGAKAESPAISQAEPEPTPEPTDEPVVSRWEEIEGTTVRFDYIISAGDVAVSGLLLTLILSVWVFGGLFFIGGHRD